MNVCISEECPLYIECERSAINNIGTHSAENYATYGGGIANVMETRTYYACGRNGDYRMYQKGKGNRELLKGEAASGNHL